MRLAALFRRHLSLLFFTGLVVFPQNLHLATLHSLERILFAPPQRLEHARSEFVVILAIPIIGRGGQRPPVAFSRLLQSTLYLLVFLLRDRFPKDHVSHPELVLRLFGQRRFASRLGFK